MAKPKLLLADDSITIQKVVSLTFVDRGMDVVVFSDGDAAIEHLDEEKPDIVLADVNMPGINGYQVCELIRSNDGTKETPVVLLVGSFEPFDNDEADRVGANSHLTKPFTSIGDLVATVERLLGEVAESRQRQQADTVPGPDTSDIDSLYRQSFVETMDMPESGAIEYEVDGYDDEMIQTSYAQPDLGPPVGESLYEARESDLRTVEIEENDAEALIAESMPPDEASPEPLHEDDRAESDTEPVEAVSVEPETTSDTGDAPQSVPADPFASVAADPPPAASPLRFSFEDDLLELPGAARPTPAYSAPPNLQKPDEVSPELIEIIVQKVIDRLDRRERGEDARSVSGS